MQTKTKTIPRQYYRVATFSVTEFFRKSGEEWFRVSRPGSTLDDVINDFLQKNNAKVITISTPGFQLLTETETTKTYRVSAAITYEIALVVTEQDGGSAEPIPEEALRVIKEQLERDGNSGRANFSGIWPG
jgi:hypothetical protein